MRPRTPIQADGTALARRLVPSVRAAKPEWMKVRSAIVDETVMVEDVKHKCQMGNFCEYR